MSRIPTLRLYLQSVEVQFQFVAIAIGSTRKSTFEEGIIFCRGYKGIVTATYYLVINNHLLFEFDVNLAVTRHTAHVTTAVERTEHRGIRLIPIDIIKNHVRHQTHCNTVHISGKLCCIGQVHRVELCAIARNVRSLHGAKHTLQSARTLIVFNHVLTVVAQEHIVGNDMRTNLQFHHRICLHRLQRGTVTTAIDGTTDDRRMVGICSRHTDRHLFGIWTEVVEGFYGCFPFRNRIIEFAIYIMTYQISIISIRIRAVTATIDITTDTCMNTDGITAIDTSCDVVTTIDIVHVATIYNDTSRQSLGHVIGRSVR